MDTCTVTTQLIEAIPACDRAPRAAVSGRVAASGMWLALSSAVAPTATVPTSKYFHRQMNVPAARGGPS
jgi:hypothetical protein